MLPSGSITISPVVLGLRGSEVKIEWSSPTATLAVIDNGIGSVTPATGGSITVFVMFHTTFSITFSNTDGSFTTSASVVEDPDIPQVNSEESTIVNVYRNVGAGTIFRNIVRPYGDGTPSYQIRSGVSGSLPPPVPTVASFIYTISRLTPFVGLERVVLSAINVANKTSPFLVSNTTITDFESAEYPPSWAAPKSLFVDNNYLYYYSNKAPASLILRANDYLNPAIVSTVSLYNNPAGVIKYNNFLLFLELIGSAENIGLEKMDISSLPTIPATTYTISGFGSNSLKASGIQPFVIGNGILYAATMGSVGFDKLSSVDPSFGSWSFGTTNAPDDDSTWYQSMSGLAIKGNYIYKLVEYSVSGPHALTLEIIDCTNNYNEVVPVGGRIAPGNDGSIAQLNARLYISGNYLLVFGGMWIGNTSLWVYDISVPTAPSLVNSYSLGNYHSLTYQVCFDGRYLYVVSSNEGAFDTFERVLSIYDASNMANITLVSSIALENSATLGAIPYFIAVGCYPNGFVEGGNYEITP